MSDHRYLSLLLRSDDRVNVLIGLNERMCQPIEAERLTSNISSVLCRIDIAISVDLAVFVTKLPQIAAGHAMADGQFRHLQPRVELCFLP